MRRPRALLCVACLFLAPQAVLAWGAAGHRIVAELGENKLSPDAEDAVRGIAGTRSLAMLSTWPDFIRSEPAWDFARP